MESFVPFWNPFLTFVLGSVDTRVSPFVVVQRGGHFPKAISGPFNVFLLLTCPADLLVCNMAHRDIIALSTLVYFASMMTKRNIFHFVTDLVRRHWRLFLVTLRGNTLCYWYLRGTKWKPCEGYRNGLGRGGESSIET